MITQMKVKNYKSFKDEVCINICQEKSVIGIVGRNASGKSSIFEVLYNIKGIISNKKSIDLCYIPNAFAKEDEPCEITVKWSINNTTYTYFIKFDNTKIYKESFKNGATIFSRDGINLSFQNMDDKPEEILIDDATKKLSSFYLFSILKTVFKLHPDFSIVLSEINTSIASMYVTLDHSDSQRILEEESHAIKQNLKDIRISNLTSKADPTLFGVVTEIALQEEIQKIEDANRVLGSKILIKSAINNLIEIMNNFNFPDLKKYKCVGYHVVNSDRGTIDYKEESEGTKKLFRLSPTIWRVLDNGGYFFVDELDSAIHPALIANVLVPLFNNSKTNPKKAKLIFSMHNIGLLLYPEFRKNTTILGIQANIGNERNIVPIPIKNTDDIDKLINDFYGVTPIILSDDFED